MLRRSIPDWKECFEPNANGHVDCDGYHFVSEIRALVRWLYRGSILGDIKIREAQSNDTNSEPSTLTVAIDLYRLGYAYSPKLQDSAMAFIFRYFKVHRTVPSFEHVKSVYYEDTENEMRLSRGPLQLFFADLYYHFGCADMETIVDGGLGFPRGFLLNVLRRRCELLENGLGNGPQGGLVGSAVLLRDYLDNPEVYRNIKNDQDMRYIID
jgi:hypothetical protein